MLGVFLDVNLQCAPAYKIRNNFDSRTRITVVAG
jgi:hypothetical protein